MKYTDETIMPFGTKKGKQLKDISDGYFLGLFDSGIVKGALRDYIEDRIPVLRFMKEEMEKKE